MTDLNKLRQFIALARYGSFARAAEQLHVAQPSLTRAVQTLEQEYGTSLVERDRGRRGATLTDAGVELLRHADTIVRAADELELSMGRSMRARPRVSFGMGSRTAHAFAGAVVAELMAELPDAIIEVAVADPARLTERLLAGEIEFYIGISAGDMSRSRIRTRVFGRVIPTIAARIGHPLAGRRAIPVDDVIRFPIVSGSSWPGVPVSMSASFDQRLFDSSVRIEQYDILEQITRDSDAVMLTTYHPGHGLVALDVAADLESHSVEVLVHSLGGLLLSPLAERIIDAVRARAASSTRM